MEIIINIIQRGKLKMFIRVLFVIMFSYVACVPSVFADAAQDDKEAIEKFLRSEEVKKIHDSAYGYAVFPTIGKGGFGIGAAHGKGRVYAAGKKIGDVSMTQISFGFQAGGQIYRQVIYFQDSRALKDFTAGEFEFSAQAEAIAITSSAGVSAGTEGTSASANENQAKASYRKGILVFTMGKGGLMYQAALGGQKYDYKASN